MCFKKLVKAIGNRLQAEDNPERALANGGNNRNLRSRRGLLWYLTTPSIMSTEEAKHGAFTSAVARKVTLLQSKNESRSAM